MRDGLILRVGMLLVYTYIHTPIQQWSMFELSLNRSWNSGLETTMNTLEVNIMEECDAYIANIKQHVLKVGKK